MREEAVWLEVSLVVDGELAEAVAEVLARYAPTGVVIESTAVTSNPDDTEGHEVGPLRVAAYLRMDEKIEETRRHVDEALWYLGRIRPLPIAQYRPVKETDWSEAWKQHYHPIEIGQHLVIVPAWLDTPPGTRTHVRMDPGMAFGTGTHPTTQLCLEAIEAWVDSYPDQDVLDIGCGSGILAVAALKLGARRALAVDIDPDAYQATLENASLNEVSERLEAGVGSLAEVLAGQFILRQAPLVLANILAVVLVRLLDEGLGKLVAPGGLLVLSGIIAEQVTQVQAALERNGLRQLNVRQNGDWVALEATR